MMWMHKEKKRYLIGISAAIILCFIIMLPQIYFFVMDSYAYQREHKMKEITFELSSDVKDIIMVQRLHELLDSYFQESNLKDTFLVQNESTIQITNGLEISDGAKKVKSILKEAGLMKYIDSQIFHNIQYCAKIKFENNLVQYRFAGVHWGLDMKFDNKTKKLYYMKYNGKNLREISNEEVCDLEKNYIKYMNLSLVEDWNYNNKKMVSKKSHLSLGVWVSKKNNTLELAWKIAD